MKQGDKNKKHGEKISDAHYIYSPPLLSFRALVSMLCFFGYMNMFMQRLDLSVAIVCMINHTDVTISSNINESAVKFSDCGGSEENATQDMEDGDLRWSKEMQGIAHGSIFWGYLTSQVIGGMLSMYFGGKAVFSLAIFLSSLTKFATPFAARFHFGIFIVLRIVLGICCGVMFPAGYTVMSRWVPPKEQNRLIGRAMAGGSAGTVIALFLGGYLCRHGFAQGWPSIFYVFGISGLIWCLLWLILVTDSPQTNRWVSQEERCYIEKSLKGAIDDEKANRVPWRSILTSFPLWVTVITHLCYGAVEYTVLTQLPTYLREVLGFTITQNGLLSAIPYAIEILLLFSFSHLADVLTTKRLLKRSTSRKIFNSLGFLPLAVLALTVTFLPCSMKGMVVAALTIGIALSGCHKLGFVLTLTDLAPQFTGVIFGISNTVGTLPGVVMPMVVAVMTPQRTREQWNGVFYLNAAVAFFGALLFILFSSTDLQDWARPNEEEVMKKDEEIMQEGAWKEEDERV